VRRIGLTFPAAQTATVSWTAPKYVNSGAIIGYRVRSCTVNVCAAWMNLPATALSVTFRGLTGTVSYRVEVQAMNGSGYGPTASLTFRQTRELNRAVVGMPCDLFRTADVHSFVKRKLTVLRFSTYFCENSV
jgi:hypothetical protein